MLEFRDLLQWDRFITPSIVKTFYLLVIVLIVLSGLSGMLSGLTAMAVNPFAGLLLIMLSLGGIVAGIIFARIATEFVLVVFRINDHLSTIREHGDGMR